MTSLRVAAVLALALSPWAFPSPPEKLCLLRGQVLGPAGFPTEGARIMAAGFLAGEGNEKNLVIQETESGTEGRFALPCPGEETLVIRVEAPGWAVCSIPNPTHDRDLILRLQIGVTLQGALLDSKQHRPLAGGRVELLENPPDGELPEELRALFRRTAVTGQDGRFFFEKVPEGVHLLAAKVPGFSSQTHGPFPVGGPPSNPPLVVLMMEPGQQLGGLVLDHTGGPVEGAEVQLGFFAEKNMKTMTDSQGRFEFEEFFGRGLAIKVKREGFVPTRRVWWPFVENSDRDQIFKLQAARPVRLQLLDETGRPLAGTVEWSFECEKEECCGAENFPRCSSWFEGEESVSAEGTLFLKDLPPARGKLMIHLSGLVGPPIGIPASRQELVRDLGSVQLTRGASLEGVVKDDRGEFLSGAEIAAFCQKEMNIETDSFHVSLNLRKARSSAEGRFIVTGLDPEKSYVVWAGAPGYCPANEDDVQPGTTAVTLTLNRTGRVQASLQDETTGQPLTVFEIENHGVFQNAEGTVVLENLKPGEETLSFGAPGHVTRTLDVAIQPGETTELGPVPLKRGARADGRVVDLRNGEGIAGVQVEVVWGPGEWGHLNGMEGGGNSNGTVTGPDGEFALNGLVPGIYRVLGSAEGFVDFQDTFRIQPGESWVLWTMALDPGGSLSLKVEDQEGQPISRCYLKVQRGPFEGQDLGITDSEGRLDLTALPPGTITVNSYGICGDTASEGGGLVTWKGIIRSGQTTEAVVRLESLSDDPDLEEDSEMPTAGSLRGRLVDAQTGEGFKPAFVTAQALSHGPLMMEDPPEGWDAASEDGWFLMEDMDPGTYGLRVEAEPFLPFFIGPFVIEKGKCRDLGTIEVGNQLVCRVKVKDEGDNAVAGAQLFRVFNGETWIYEASSTRTGRLDFTRTPQIKTDMVLLRQGYAPFWLPPLDCQGGPFMVTLAAGEPVTLEVRDPQEAPVPALKANLKDEWGRPVGSLSASRGLPSPSILMTDEKGQLRLDSLAPGSYSAEFLQGDRTVASGTLHIRPGRSLTSIFHIR